MKVVKAWGPAVLWMTLIFLLSTRQRISVADEQIINFLFFKTLHIIEYAILFFLIVRGLHYTFPKERLQTITLTAFLLTVLYGASDETHQMFVPTREGRLRDVIIDATGAGLSWIFLLYILPRLPKTPARLVKTLLNRA